MPASRSAVVSSFTVIKGAQVERTYELFGHWDLGASKKENLDRLKRTTPVGSDTANWWRDVAKVVNRRFDTDGRDRVLVELARAHVPLEIWRPLLLWHMTRDEFLVRDFLVNWLYAQRELGVWRVRTDDVLPYLAQLHGRSDVVIQDAWSQVTTGRVASGLLRMAVDFGLMAGTAAREFVSYHLPDESLRYLLHAVTEVEPNADRLLGAADWRMYQLSPDDLQRELFRLHQHGCLYYAVAGSVAELRLPYASAAAYAREELIR